MSSEASTFTAIKDQAVGAIKQTLGSMTGNPKMELVGMAQKIHGKNEYEYAQAYKQGETEPEKFRQAYHETPQDLAEGTVEGEHPSTISAKADQFVGGVKESFGNATGNQNMELLGKAQKVHGRNEAEFAKSERQGLNEPEHFVQGTKITDHAEGTVEGEKASSLSAIKDRTIGAIKETIGSTTGNQNMELLGKAQKVHGRNEAEFAKADRQGLSEPEHFAQGTKTSDHAEGKIEGENPSTISSLKDRALGSVKETIGSATGNQTMELTGKAQSMHGRNEAEFAKAQSQGKQEPEHFVQGTKTCDQAEGTVEGDSSSTFSGLKDRAVGAMKETAGSITGNQKMELIGRAQNVHGRNEVEFAKAEKHGETEPQHFTSGTKSFDQAEGTVEGDKPSTMSAMKDRTIGAVKEGLGSAMGDQKMELIGKAQIVHGRNEAEFVKAEKQGLSQPQHFDKGTHDVPLAQGSVEDSSPSTLSALKDQAVGSVKETFGSATGDQRTELIGKAQKVHGRNEAQLARDGQQA